MSTKKTAFINKDMLIWARSETPFTAPADVEIQTKGISAEKLTKWENGTDLPSLTEAKKLAKIYKVPLACFYLATPPEKKVKAYTDRRTSNTTDFYENSYTLWCEINRITSIRDKILEYDNSTTFPSIPSLGSKATIQETATALRDFLGLELPFRSKNSYNNNAFNYFRNIFELHGIIVAQLSGVPLSEMKGLSIFYDSYSIIAVNNRDFEKPKVFSMFHELAHLIRRSSSLCLIDFDERNSEEEKICDTIAGETLMEENSFRPLAHKIHSQYGKWSSNCLQSIGDKFGLSSLAVLLRLHELKIVQTEEYRNIYTLLSNEFEDNRKHIEQQRKGKNLPIKYHHKYLNREGFLFPRLVLNAHTSGQITFGEACTVLGVNSKHIGSIEQAVMYK